MDKEIKVGDIRQVLEELDEAERRAWDALSRYKFYLFGYWACHWVNLNRWGKTKKPNPFSKLVKEGKSKCKEEEPIKYKSLGFFEGLNEDE